MNQFKNFLALFPILAISSLMVISCQAKKEETLKEETLKVEIVEEEANELPADEVALIDTIVISRKHKPNAITCDLDGDKLADQVTIVRNTLNDKYGLKIAFGNRKVSYLGMGEKVAGQDFDDIEWVGIFEVAPKGEKYSNNVSEEGEILTEDQIDEKDMIKLTNDGIFIHQAESCGGGVIYLVNGNFEWIQQE